MKPVRLLLTTAIILGFSVLLAQAQGSKNVSISNFNGLSVSNGIDLHLTQGNAENVRINAHPDLLKNVIVEKEGNVLRIRYKDNISWSRLFKGQEIKVFINYKKLESISASGGSDVFGENNLKTDRMTINASGGSDITIKLETNELKIQSSGGSDVDLQGTATNIDVSISGGSDLDATDLITSYAKVTASGGSDANIHVTKALEANASGGSDINYKGNAAVRKTSSNKSGDVSRIQ